MTCRWSVVALIVTLVGAPGHAPQGTSAPDIRGGWQAETYALESGERHALKGQIVEGGTYTLVEGTHLGLPSGNQMSFLRSSRF